MRLTPREAQIAAMISRSGLSNKEMAAKLGISEFTVREYVASLSQKLSGPGRPRHKITLFFLKLSDQSDGDHNPS